MGWVLVFATLAGYVAYEMARARRWWSRRALELVSRAESLLQKTYDLENFWLDAHADALWARIEAAGSAEGSSKGAAKRALRSADLHVEPRSQHSPERKLIAWAAARSLLSALSSDREQEAARHLSNIAIVINDLEKIARLRSGSPSKASVLHEEWVLERVLADRWGAVVQAERRYHELHWPGRELYWRQRMLR